MSDAILAAIILVPLFLAYLLKSSAALGFLALCAGYAVQSFAAGNIKSLVSKAGLSVSIEAVGVFIILIPTVITLLICRGPSSRSPTNPKAFLNLLTALALGGSFAIMAVPSLGRFGGSRLSDASFWNAIEKAQTEIIVIGALLSLILIWLGHRKPHDKHHK